MPQAIADDQILVPTVTMKLKKETKNKYVYQAVNPDFDGIPTVYIEKTALPSMPRTICLTIHECE